jgi:hypothetical protein
MRSPLRKGTVPSLPISTPSKLRQARQRKGRQGRADSGQNESVLCHVLCSVRVQAMGRQASLAPSSGIFKNPPSRLPAQHPPSAACLPACRDNAPLLQQPPPTRPSTCAAPTCAQHPAEKQQQQQHPPEHNIPLLQNLGHGRGGLDAPHQHPALPRLHAAPRAVWEARSARCSAPSRAAANACIQRQQAMPGPSTPCAALYKHTNQPLAFMPRAWRSTGPSMSPSCP